MLILRNSKAVNGGVLASADGAVVSAAVVVAGEVAAAGEDLPSSEATIVDGAGNLQQNYA